MIDYLLFWEFLDDQLTHNRMVEKIDDSSIVNFDNQIENIYWITEELLSIDNREMINFDIRGTINFFDNSITYQLIFEELSIDDSSIIN